MSVKLLTEHNLVFLRLIGGCRGSSESTFVKMQHYWKSHVAAHKYDFGISFSFLTAILVKRPKYVHHDNIRF